MKRKILSVGAAIALAATGAIALSGCGKDSAPAEEVVTETEVVDEGSESAADAGGTAADLEEARQVVLKTLDDKGDMKEIMLASDVSSPEQKYGMWVVPYTFSDATEKVDSKIDIDGGKFVINGTAADGTVYQIDQDGNITEVSE